MKLLFYSESHCKNSQNGSLRRSWQWTDRNDNDRKIAMTRRKMDIHINEVEIFSGIYRLTLAPKSQFEFNQFLLIDEKTCLVHAGKASLFNPLLELVKKNLAGRLLDYIIFSHFEADECGAVNSWLKEYPNAKVVCNKVANISLEDFLIRPAQVLGEGEHLELGKKSLRLINTPHFPHNWDAHMWYEVSEQILFSSDFCCQGNICEPTSTSDLSKSIIDFYVTGGFIPYGKTTNIALDKIVSLPISIIAPMHGSVILGKKLCQTVLEKVKKDLVSRS